MSFATITIAIDQSTGRNAWGHKIGTGADLIDSYFFKAESPLTTKDIEGKKPGRNVNTHISELMMLRLINRTASGYEMSEQGKGLVSEWNAKQPKKRK